MTKNKSAIAFGCRSTLQNPGLWPFAFLVLLGGVVSISFVLLDIIKNLFIFNLWLQYRGLLIAPRILAMSLGFLISLVIMFFVSSFAKGIIIQVVSAKYYEKKDMWQGSLKKSLNSLSVNFRITASFYIFSILALVALYESIIFLVRSIPYTVFGYWFWLSLMTLIAVFIVFSFGIIAIFASNFVTIFKLKYFKALSASFDLFLLKPLESLWFLIKLLLMGIVFFSAVFFTYSLGLYIYIKIAVNTGNILLSGQGLISTGLIVIMYMLLVLFYSISYSAWTYFFLENVGGMKIVEKAAGFEISRNTAIQGTLNNV